MFLKKNLITVAILAQGQKASLKVSFFKIAMFVSALFLSLVKAIFGTAAAKTGTAAVAAHGPSVFAASHGTAVAATTVPTPCCTDYVTSLISKFTLGIWKYCSTSEIHTEIRERQAEEKWSALYRKAQKFFDQDTQLLPDEEFDYSDFDLPSPILFCLRIILFGIWCIRTCTEILVFAIQGYFYVLFH